MDSLKNALIGVGYQPSPKLKSEPDVGKYHPELKPLALELLKLGEESGRNPSPLEMLLLVAPGSIESKKRNFQTIIDRLRDGK